MPASLYEANLGHHNHYNTSDDMEDNRAVKLAYELAMLGLDNVPHSMMHSNGGGPSSPGANSLNGLDCHSLNMNCNAAVTLAQLEELKTRKSQNMTECVPVPTSEHVAEIVGRQGCKIKALRAKTNTYIKTPVRGEEPVFVVTGRKEDVNLAKREILSAADHFSQIRASRKNNINSTLAFGQMVANTPGQTTIQVRVPYRVVGLVVGPKGATIKRIQQQTHTYIVTPSRDKEPVFEVTGLPENVDTARKEIESHIALRTGTGMDGCLDGLVDGMEGSYSTANSSNNFSNSAFSSAGSSSALSAMLSDATGNNTNILINKLSNSSGGSGSSMLNGMGGNRSNENSLDQLQLHGLLDGNSSRNGFNDKSREISIGSALWGCSDSHDSGIGHSPPYDSSHSLSGLTANGSGVGGAIWNELGKVLGSLDSSPGADTCSSNGSSVSNYHNSINHHLHSSVQHNHHNNQTQHQFNNSSSVAISKQSPTTPRSASIDLGIPASNGGFINNSNTTMTNGCGISNNSGMMNGVSSSSNDHHINNGQFHTSSVSTTMGSNTSLAQSFSMTGLTTSLASLSASLNTLTDNNSNDDILACLRRNGSPDVEISSEKLHSAFSSALHQDSKPIGGLGQRDFLSFANH